MAINLPSLVSQLITPDLIERAAAIIGIDPALAGKLVGAAIPSVLGAFASEASSPDGAKGISDLISSQDPGPFDTLTLTGTGTYCKGGTFQDSDYHDDDDHDGGWWNDRHRSYRRSSYTTATVGSTDRHGGCTGSGGQTPTCVTGKISLTFVDADGTGKYDTVKIVVTDNTGKTVLSLNGKIYNGNLITSDAARTDNNHLLNTLWIYAVGDRPTWFAYRLFSILTGSAAIAATGLALRRVGRVESLVAAVLVAASYPMIVYSSEARGYAPAVFFAATAIRLYALSISSRAGRPSSSRP